MVGPEGDARAARCECQADRQTDALYSTAQVPPRYANCRFQTFRVGEAGGEIEKAYRIAQKYADDYPALAGWKHNGLLLIGNAGVGKTHLAVAILHRLLEKGMTCRFVDHRSLLKEIQATFDPANPATEAGVVRPLLDSEVLLLDDLGVGRATEWAQETLHYILNHRYSHKRATLITTNLEDDEPRAGTRDAAGNSYEPQTTLVQAVTARLRSRLYEMCQFVPVHGRDHRRAE